MKILLTGKPKSGKTTLLNRLLEQVNGKQGMVAVEVVQNGQRVGFDLQDASGRTAILARTNQKTSAPVGRYFVNIESLNDFTGQLFTFEPGQLLYIDEIGHMQLYSDVFKQLVRTYINSANDYLGTISCIYEHSFIDEIKQRKDILLCTITPDNRAAVFAALSAALKHRAIFNGLPVSVQSRIVSIAQEYVRTESYISLRKLCNNAVVYVAEDRVQRASPTAFVIQGNHGDHRVERQNDSYNCDCDLFNGRGLYIGKASECSHIQAVRVLSQR